MNKEFKWSEVKYSVAPGGAIKLPQSAPFDGKPVMIKTKDGIAKARWSDGTPVSVFGIGDIRRYGPYFICFDDLRTVELSEVEAWAPVNDQESE